MEQSNAIDKSKITIDNIPAILWGKPCDRIFIHVHGKMSRKEYAESFAQIAQEKGYQTISFDLPEHGERMNQEHRCDVWNGMHDLNRIADYAYANWKEVSLFACSLGAYFALQTYTDRKFQRILFQSPIVDMRWLVEHMMVWSGVTEAQLKEAQEIDTPIDSLRWDYYSYIKTHPTTKWQEDARILYGDMDDLQELSCLTDFADRFKASLTISKGSRHPFMEERDYPIVARWMQDNL